MYDTPNSPGKNPDALNNQKQKTESRQEPDTLFHVDSFRRADIHAGLAVDAHILVDFGLVVLHGDCRCGTFAHAGFTSGTLIVVNDCYQLVHSGLYVSIQGKKRITIRAQDGQDNRDRKKGVREKRGW